MAHRAVVCSHSINDIRALFIILLCVDAYAAFDCGVVGSPLPFAVLFVVDCATSVVHLPTLLPEDAFFLLYLRKAILTTNSLVAPFPTLLKFRAELLDFFAKLLLVLAESFDLRLLDDNLIYRPVERPHLSFIMEVGFARG